MHLFKLFYYVTNIYMWYISQTMQFAMRKEFVKQMWNFSHDNSICIKYIDLNLYTYFSLKKIPKEKTKNSKFITGLLR